MNAILDKIVGTLVPTFAPIIEFRLVGTDSSQDNVARTNWDVL